MLPSRSKVQHLLGANNSFEGAVHGSRCTQADSDTQGYQENKNKKASACTDCKFSKKRQI